MSEPPEYPAPRRRWYQVTLKNAFYATLWMAVGFAAYPARLNRWIGRDDLLTVATLAVFVALGTLFGRPVLGLVMWIICASAIFIASWVWFLVSLSNGWTRLPLD